MARKISAVQYLLGYVALLVLVSLNLGLSFLDLPNAGLTLALVLAATTVVIVVLVFMHLLEHAPTIIVVALTSVFFLVLLATLMLLDVVARAPETQPATYHDVMHDRG
jgi:cytochrome c oxidase subunit IV